MAQIRGSFFSSLRAALERRSYYATVGEGLAVSSRRILDAAEATAWYDEGHVVAVYEAALRLHGKDAPRLIGRDAARIAMASTWRDLMQALEGLLGGTPRMAFEQMPVLWNATRRDAGELRCVESSTKHAITELRGFAYATSTAWNDAWVGHHEALLRHLRFTGTAASEPVAGASTSDVALRIRTSWTSSALRRNDTLP